MADEKTVVSVVATPEKVGPGYIDFTVESVGVWTDPAFNYSKARVGWRGHPASLLTLRIPVDGLNDGEPICTADLASVLEQAMSTLVPACKGFVEAAQTDFGCIDPPDDETVPTLDYSAKPRPDF